MERALKVRNMAGYFALSVLSCDRFKIPGATRLAPLGACPWQSYFAPSALVLEFRLGGKAESALVHKFRLGGKAELALVL